VRVVRVVKRVLKAYLREVVLDYRRQLYRVVMLLKIALGLQKPDAKSTITLSVCVCVVCLSIQYLPSEFFISLFITAFGIFFVGFILRTEKFLGLDRRKNDYV